MSNKKQLPQFFWNKKRLKKQFFVIGSNDKSTSGKRAKMSKIGFEIKFTE